MLVNIAKIGMQRELILEKVIKGRRKPWPLRHHRFSEVCDAHLRECSREMQDCFVVLRAKLWLCGHDLKTCHLGSKIFSSNF